MWSTGLPSKSIGLTIYSPPFAGLYNYSSSDRDISNCSSTEEFFEHYAFVIRETFRVTRQELMHPHVGPTDSRWIAVLMEEVGEVARAILEEDEDSLVEELVQVAAVAIRILEIRACSKDLRTP